MSSAAENEPAPGIPVPGGEQLRFDLGRNALGITRVDCHSFFVHRPLLYLGGGLMDIPAARTIIGKSIERGSTLVSDPHVTGLDGREALAVAAFHRKKGSTLIDAIETVRQVGSGRPAAKPVGLIACSRYGPTHVGFELDDEGKELINGDIAALLKRFRRSRKDLPGDPAVYHLSIVKAPNREEAERVAAQFNELMQERELRTRLGHMTVQHTIAKRVPLSKALKWNADIKSADL